MDDPERRPLLATAPGSSRDPVQVSATSSAEKARRRRLLLLICISIVAADFAILLSYAPQLTMLESLICRDLRHTAVPIATASLTQAPDPFCKSPLVQGDLVLLTGWKETFDTIPGILLALPYGYAADRFGRKPVLLLSLTGLILEELSVRLVLWWHTTGLIPLRTLWFMPLFQIIGGGPQIASSMAYAMVTDLFSAAERASVFFLIGAAIIVGEILAGPLSAIMTVWWSPWFPVITGLGLQLAAFFAAATIPETMATHISDDDIAREPSPSTINTADRNNQPTDEETCVSHPGPSKAILSLRRHCKSSPSRAILSLQEHCRPPSPQQSTKPAKRGLLTTNVLSLVFSFLLASVGRQALQLIFQYASKRFSWSMEISSLVITLKACVNLLALVSLLPKISSYLLKRKNGSAAEKDRIIVQGSTWLLTIGALIMVLSGPCPGVFIFGVGVLALGWGYYSAVRSLAATMVPASEIGLMSTLLGWAQSAGTMVAGPSLALTFKKGMELGGFWFGLPYFVAGGLFFGSATLVSLGVRVQSQDDEDGDGDAGSSESG